MKKVIIKIPDKKPTTTVAIRMEADVKKWYKARKRKGYTVLMAQVLKAYIESQQ